jgi:alpha-galactosidase
MDHPDDAWSIRGVVSADKSKALFAAVCVSSSDFSPPGLARFTGLDQAKRYTVKLAEISQPTLAAVPYPPPTWTEGVTLSGTALAGHGLQLPELPPDQGILVEFEAL